jgi:hypothetical protein
MPTTLALTGDTFAVLGPNTSPRLWMVVNLGKTATIHDPGGVLGHTTAERLLTSARDPGAYRQLGSQISMFQVAWEMGVPVSTGNNQAKFVITSAM